MAWGTIKWTGVGTVRAKLRNIAQKVPNHAARTMRQETEKIVTLSKLQCPHDTGDLEDSIHAEEARNEGNNRLVIDVVAGGMIGDHNIDDYAALIHENYEGMKPGPGTLAKMAANPGIVIGSKFIERAVDNSEDRLMKAEIEAITEVIDEA